MNRYQKIKLYIGIPLEKPSIGAAHLKTGLGGGDSNKGAKSFWVFKIGVILIFSFEETSTKPLAGLELTDFACFCDASWGTIFSSSLYSVWSWSALRPTYTGKSPFIRSSFWLFSSRIQQFSFSGISWIVLFCPQTGSLIWVGSCSDTVLLEWWFSGLGAISEGSTKGVSSIFSSSGMRSESFPLDSSFKFSELQPSWNPRMLFSGLAKMGFF